MKIVGIILISLSLFVFLYYFTLRTNNNFVNLRSIVENHLKTFKMTDSNKWMKVQIFFFFINPLFLAFGLAMMYRINRNIVDGIMVAIAILISMLFAVQSVILGIEIEDDADRQLTIKLIKQTSDNITFYIVVCVGIAIMSLIYLFGGDFSSFISKDIIKVLSAMFSVIFYYLCFVLILGLMMITKRMSVIISKKHY